MGLFEFLKKPKSGTASSRNTSGDSASGEPESVFMGDLALLSESSSQNKTESVPQKPINSNIAATTKDSSDSVVFMTFDSGKNERWGCSECGTMNDNELDGCIVCGLKR